MGQRHQAFLIARVRPHGALPNDPGQRRCVAAIHHQWCYGIRPLVAMRRLITLMSHPENAAVVRAELRAIDGRYGQHSEEEPMIPDIPCPYAASLLASAYTTDLDAGREIYSSGGTAEQDIYSASMSCWGGHNDDGISILDITEPENPAHCFLLAHDVLDASGYLKPYDRGIGYRTYLPRGRTIDVGEHDTESESESQDEFRFQRDERWYQRLRLRAIDSLRGVPIIRAELLKQAWPYVHFVETGPSPASSTTTTEVVEAGVSSRAAVPSLVNLTFDAAVKHSLDTADASDLDQLILLPGKAPEIKKVLRSLKPFPDSGIQLLIRVLSELKEDTCVDLSDFQLSGTQLIEVLSDRGEVAFLNASFNSVLVAEDISKLVEGVPTLRRLVVIGCPSIVDAHILALVQKEPSRFKTLEGLLHPVFLTVDKPDRYPIAFTLVDVVPTFDGDLTWTSVPFFTPAQVIQALIDVLPWKDAKINRGLGGSINPMAWFSAIHGGARTPDEKFGRRAVVSVPFLSPRITRGQQEFWVFAVYRASKYDYTADRSKNKKNTWGFVHITTSEEHSVGEASRPASDSGTTGRLECSGQLYDLRGFLECMASEGRPMPSDAAVKELERILYKKHRKTGEFYCPFMGEEDMRKIGIEPASLTREVG